MIICIFVTKAVKGECDVKLSTNGFIIQDSSYMQSYSKKNIIYRGIDGYSFPSVSKKWNEVNEKIYEIDKMRENNNNIVAVCNDINLLNSYLKACENEKIKTRILLCETER